MVVAFPVQRGDRLGSGRAASGGRRVATGRAGPAGQRCTAIRRRRAPGHDGSGRSRGPRCVLRLRRQPRRIARADPGRRARPHRGGGGTTGSGKSSLAGLLVRLVSIRTPARSLLDQVDVRRLARGQVAGSAALVFQQAFVFEDSVRENVTLGLPSTDDEVSAALHVAQASRFVAALPDGLDSIIGERGATLSGGQRQRLALARAVVRRPRLLVLDDATSAVDPEVERRILAGLRSTELPATVVVVAYRRATIALADEVVYVEHGRTTARGPHQKLMVSSARLSQSAHRL